MAEVGSLIKGIEILRQLSPEPDGLTAAEIGERLDIPRTTAIRFLNTLCRHNYAVKAGSSYYLGPAALGSVDKRSFQTGLDVIQRWPLRRPVNARRPDGRGMGDHWRPAAA